MSTLREHGPQGATGSHSWPACRASRSRPQSRSACQPRRVPPAPSWRPWRGAAAPRRLLSTPPWGAAAPAGRAGGHYRRSGAPAATPSSPSAPPGQHRTASGQSPGSLWHARGQTGARGWGHGRQRRVGHWVQAGKPAQGMPFGKLCVAQHSARSAAGGPRRPRARMPAAWRRQAFVCRLPCSPCSPAAR